MMYELYFGEDTQTTKISYLWECYDQ